MRLFYLWFPAFVFNGIAAFPNAFGICSGSEQW